jgi:hypothetical protein
MKTLDPEKRKISKFYEYHTDDTYLVYSRQMIDKAGKGIDTDSIRIIRTGNLSVFSNLISNRNIIAPDAQNEATIVKSENNL